MWVEQTKNGKYKFIERYEDYLTGKQKRVSVTLDRNTAQSRKTAERTLAEKIKELEPTQQRTKNLFDLVEAYRVYQEKAVKPSTYRRNRFATAAILDLLGPETRLDRLSANYVRTAFLKSDKEPGYLNELLTRFKALIRWGFKNDLIENIDFLQKLEKFQDTPHREKIQDKYLEGDELKRLLDAMKIDRWRLMTEFLALSGLRFGEASALLKSDIDLVKRVIHVNKNYDSNNKVVTTPKTSCSVRDIFIQDELVRVLQEIKITMLRQSLLYGYRVSELLFQNTKGEHINFYEYSKYLRVWSNKSLGRAITPHALRHTHASLLMERGVSIDAISRRLGHENSRITREIYLHVTKKLQDQDNLQIKQLNIL